MSWALLAALLAAEDRAPEFQPQATVWLQPLGLLLAVVSPNSGQHAVYLSAGASVVVRPHFVIAGEFSGYQSKSVQPTPDRETYERRALMMAIGPIFNTGSEPFGGFFIHPKLIGELGEASFRDEFPPRGGPLYSVQVGVTGGWQFRWKRLYLALSIGLSIGVGNERLASNGPLNAGPGFGRGIWGVQFGGDFNLLRIGIAL